MSDVVIVAIVSGIVSVLSAYINHRDNDSVKKRIQEDSDTRKAQMMVLRLDFAQATGRTIQQGDEYRTAPLGGPLVRGGIRSKPDDTK